MLSSLKAAPLAKILRRAPISRALSSIPSFASYDPLAAGTVSDPYAVSNIVDGKWTSANAKMDIIHPLDKDAPPIFSIPDTQVEEITPFIESLRKCSKSGMHNPLKNPERYLEYGEITRKVRPYTLWSMNTCRIAPTRLFRRINTCCIIP